MPQPTAALLALADFIEARLDEDEAIARAGSGGTVIGEPGNWSTAPGGDEWEASRTDCDEDELLVALRPGLPRPPDVMTGMWGAIVDFKPEFEDRGAASPLPQLQHAARHDPARVLAEVAAKRLLIGNWRKLIIEIDAEPDPERRERLALTRHGLDQFAFQMAAVHSAHPNYRPRWTP